ncbi:MAG: hypothetical protein ACYDDO_01340 [Acidiferrobacterales bacterium]
MSTERIRSGILAAAFTAAVLLSAGAHADGVVIRIAPPPVPRILLPAPPPMVWLPSQGIYVAHNSPQPIFFRDGRYYVRKRGIWFAAQSYGGPWGRVDARMLPPPLHAYRDRDWDRYQHEAQTHYGQREDRAHPVFYPGHHDRGNRGHNNRGGERGDHNGHRHDNEHH